MVSKGINIFDTADSYGTGKLNGKSEQLLGRFIEVRGEGCRAAGRGAGRQEHMAGRLPGTQCQVRARLASSLCALHSRRLHGTTAPCIINMGCLSTAAPKHRRCCLWLLSWVLPPAHILYHHLSTGHNPCLPPATAAPRQPCPLRVSQTRRCHTLLTPAPPLSQEYPGSAKVQANLHVATKLAAYPWRVLPANMVAACKGSLRRLGADQLALGQLHWSAANYAPLQVRWHAAGSSLRRALC